jgi:CSLREA domain-containing protein
MCTFKRGKLTSLFAALVFVAAGASNRVAALDFVVDSTMDAVDETPGDGACATAEGACTLRAAVMEANASDGVDRIDLTGISDPSDPIRLTLDGLDETFMLVPEGPAPCVAQIEANAAIGDLDITEDV